MGFTLINRAESNNHNATLKIGFMVHLSNTLESVRIFDTRILN